MSDARRRLPTLTRRQLFQIGAVGLSGYYLEPLVRPLGVSAKEKVQPRGTAEHCIFVNLAGSAQSR